MTSLKKARFPRAVARASRGTGFGNGGDKLLDIRFLWRTVCVFPALWFSLATAASAGNGLAGLQTADPSCPDDSGNIYVDCGNGTVTDNRTDLVWLANANCIGNVDWHTAMEFVSGLSDLPESPAYIGEDCGLSDGSSPGEWRLPSVDEWEAMIADALQAPDCTGTPPTLTNDAGTGCLVDGPTSFFNVEGSGFYWSSTTNVTITTSAWLVWLYDGLISHTGKTLTPYVWPVRGGQ
jgi:hypothetical protein